MDFGKKIKELRISRGWSAEDLADRCGVSPATLYRYERGTISSAPVDKIAPIADALGVSPAVIMGWDDETPKMPSSDEYAREGIASRVVGKSKQTTALDQIIDNLLEYREGSTISPDEQRLLDAYRLLNAKQKAKMFKLMDAIFDN